MPPNYDYGTADTGSWQQPRETPRIFGAHWGFWSALFVVIGLGAVMVAL
jgi:hypothetical protein